MDSYSPFYQHYKESRSTHSSMSEKISTPKVLCEHCGIFLCGKHIKRHFRRFHFGKLVCVHCFEEFLSKRQLNIHIRTHRYTCAVCQNDFQLKDHLRQHMRYHFKDTSRSVVTGAGKAANKSIDPIVGKSALKKTFQLFEFKNALHGNDVLAYLNFHQEDINDVFVKYLVKGVKWFLIIQVRFQKFGKDDEVMSDAHFRSKTQTLLLENDLEEQFNVACETISQAVKNYQKEGSGWTVDKICKLELGICRYDPLFATSYVDLPKELKGKKAVLNIKNSDEKCFLWSVLASLHPLSRFNNPQRVAKYFQYETELNMNQISYPVKISDIPKFERANDISVSVLSYELEKNRKLQLFPLYLSKLRNARHHVNLLYITDEISSHYCLIRDLNRLLSDLTGHKAKSFYCNHCLNRFSLERTLANHYTLCSQHEPQVTKLPAVGKNILKFERFDYTIRVPYVIYADFECLLIKKGLDNIQHDNTQQVASHIPSGFCYVIIGPNGLPVKTPVIYRGDDVVKRFLYAVTEEERMIQRILKTIVPMTLTQEDEETFANAAVCKLCKRPFTESDFKVRDHDHLTGRFRQALHNSCNLKLKMPSHIPVIFHNLRGYDGHLIMQGLGSLKDCKIECIPNNMEKYVSFSVGSLRFLDSLQFLNSSLENLVANLAKGSHNFPILKHYYEGDKLSLLLRKGVFPYEYMDCAEKFKETQLPPIGVFFSSLSEEHITEDDYNHATRVWDEFTISDLGAYQDLYVQTDVLLCAEVFESFRNMCLGCYEIDPAHMYTSPGLAFQSCLKMTQVELELLTDVDQHLFVEKGIIGGVAMISKRYAKANNKYLADFDTTLPSNYIIYWDMNNLYGLAMTQYLPHGGFQWLTGEEIEKLDVLTISDESDVGYILEVDLEYPPNLHSHHNCYPLAPERLIISQDMISAHTTHLLDSSQTKLMKTPRLVPHLNNRCNYVTHYRNLKLYLSLGLKLVRVHKVLRFNQSPWLKEYIDFNTKKRIEAKNDFERDLYKLLNNAMFGKTMENLRNRKNVRLVNNERAAKKLISKSNMVDFRIFDENLVAVNLTKPSVLLNRPIYVGFCVLELSKTYMYNFHYNHVKRVYGDKAELLFTDTDSLCYDIVTPDLYADVLKNQILFDTSNYPTDHPLYSNENMKVVGKMKDEFAGKIIKAFVGLKPKMYCVLTDYDVSKAVGKGIVRTVLKKHLTFQDYYNSLFNIEIQHAPMTSIRSRKHHLHTEVQNKITLSPIDFKRFLLDDNINTRAYGHIENKL